MAAGTAAAKIDTAVRSPVAREQRRNVRGFESEQHAAELSPHSNGQRYSETDANPDERDDVLDEERDDARPLRADREPDADFPSPSGDNERQRVNGRFSRERPPRPSRTRPRSPGRNVCPCRGG